MGAHSWLEAEIQQSRYDPEFVREALVIRLMEELWARMETQHITQTELAERLGVARPHVTKLLHGNGNITLDTIVKLALALELDLQLVLQPRQDYSWDVGQGQVVRITAMPITQHLVQRPVNMPVATHADAMRGGDISDLAHAA